MPASTPWLTCTLGTACNLGQLNDTNGNATVKSTAVTSAVDWVDITNGASGTPGVVTVDAAGSNSSVSLVLKSKGSTGAIVHQAGTDSTQAVLLKQADGVTVYGSFDSVNKRFRIGDATAPNQTFDVAGSFTITSTGTVPKVANVNTVGLIGIAADLGTVDLTGQGSDFNGTTGQAFGVPSGGAGTYRVSVYLAVTRAAGTSSTMPSTCVLFTDRDNNVATQLPASAASGGNSTSTASSATVFIDARQSTNIQIASGANCTGGMAYASSGSPTMQYKVRAKVEGM